MAELCIENKDLKGNPADDEYEEDDAHHFHDLGKHDFIKRDFYSNFVYIYFHSALINF